MSEKYCGIIVVDKPEGITSQGVVSRVRRALGMKRVGHGGTLDPMATGVLPIFVGRATRASGLLLDADKAYRAGFRCGFSTDTRDTTGTVIEQSGIDATVEQVKEVLQHFQGKQLQTPPMYSALKVDGKKLYELARKGMEIERKPREIEIFSIEYIGYENGEHTIDVACSKGTYIRELVHDIGNALGTGAAMSSLRRTKTGRFALDCAVVIDEVSVNEIMPVDMLFDEHPPLTVNEADERKIRCGNAISSTACDGFVRVYAPDGAFLMLGEVRERVLYTVKSFFEVD